MVWPGTLGRGFTVKRQWYILALLLRRLLRRIGGGTETPHWEQFLMQSVECMGKAAQSFIRK